MTEAVETEAVSWLNERIAQTAADLSKCEHEVAEFTGTAIGEMGFTARWEGERQRAEFRLNRFRALAAMVERALHLEHVIDRDRYIVAAGVGAVQTAIRARQWLFEGRGPYEWDDDDFRKEFGDALTSVEQAIEPLKRVAWDKSDCTRIEERVIAAKLAAAELLKQPLGPRVGIPADIGMPDPRDITIAQLRAELARASSVVS